MTPEFSIDLPSNVQGLPPARPQGGVQFWPLESQGDGSLMKNGVCRSGSPGASSSGNEKPPATPLYACSGVIRAAKSVTVW